jgi:hypothetical protein
MAQFNGFTCDSCGKVVDPAQRTKVTIRYEGNVVDGEYYQDRCPDCVAVPEGVLLKPIRRRRRRNSDDTVDGEAASV